MLAWVPIVAWSLTGLLILALIVLLIIPAAAAHLFTRPARHFDPDNHPGKHGMAYEDFLFPARGDGLQIAAWYIPSQENQRVLILVHGRDNSRTNGFVGQFVPFARALHDAGFSVMMIDLRGHGMSANARYSFSIKERNDVLGAVDWLMARGYRPGSIGVLGYSLGAGSVIGAAAQDDRIGAVWTDSAYADIQTVLEQGWKRFTGLPGFFLPPTRWMVRLLFGYDIAASRPIDEIGAIIPRPIFMAHCKNDPLIPISHLERLIPFARPREVWVIENCDQGTLDRPIVEENYNNHAIGYSLQPEVYQEKVIRFFHAHLQ